MSTDHLPLDDPFFKAGQAFAQLGRAEGDARQQAEDAARDVRYLLDIGHWGQAHFGGCATVRKGAACTCSLGRIRRQYDHWPENGCPVTESEWKRQRGEDV